MFTHSHWLDYKLHVLHSKDGNFVGAREKLEEFLLRFPCKTSEWMNEKKMELIKSIQRKYEHRHIYI